MFAARRKRVFKHLLWRSLLFYQALVEEHHFAGHLTGKAHFASTAAPAKAEAKAAAAPKAKKTAAKAASKSEAK